MSAMPYPNPQQAFQIQYESIRRDEVVGVLLAFFLGCFGLHHFYVGRVGLGILYLCFCWTGIPAILGVIECFFMPGRVRMYNAIQAAGLAVAMGIALPGYMGYPAWGVPVYPNPAYPQSIHVSVQADPYVPADATLIACGNCRQANPTGARFCQACGTQLS